MYQYVLAGDTTVFRGMMKSPSDQMLQDTFHWYIRAYLSVLFKKILCWTVGLYTWFVLGMYSVHTRSILVITGTNTKHTSIFHQARSALRRWRVSAARFLLSTFLVSCLYNICTQYEQKCSCMYNVCTMYEQKCSCTYNVCTMYEEKCSSMYNVCTKYISEPVGRYL